MSLTLRQSQARAQDPSCPDCDLSLTPYSCEGSLIHKCAKCHGLWLTGQKLGIFRHALEKFDFSSLEIYLHPGDAHAYIVSSCGHCQDVLEKFHYGYNSGVWILCCQHCRGLWLPLRQMVHLMKSLKLGQDVAPDVRGFLVELRKMDEEIRRFQNFVLLMRSLV